MMHEATTNSSSTTNFYSHSPEDVTSSQPKTAVNTGARDMLSTTAASRRAPATKSELLTERAIISPVTAGNRWRFNGTGQLVDSASSDWDLTDEMVKLQINNDVDSSIRTPPQSKTAAVIVQMQEASPLETASEASIDSASSNTLDQSPNPVHSRGSSTDTTGSSHASAFSAASQTLRASALTPLKAGSVNESRNRPHSYSGGISTADLVRLQQAGSSPGNNGENWSSPNGTPERQPQSDQLTYPSLVNHAAAQPRIQDYQQQHSGQGTRSDDTQADYQNQQRQFNNPTVQLSHGQIVGPPSYAQPNRANGATVNAQFRAPLRNFNPQVPVSGIPNPANFGYAPPVPPSVSISNQQQLYDMMLPTPPLENPTMARLQQQHNVFRGGHQHSSSDPASLRDPAALAVLNNNMQAFAAAQMYGGALPPPAALSMFANQFYGAPQDAYSPELATAQMMARLQAQYAVAAAGQFGLPVIGQSVGTPTTGISMSPVGNGPSANNRKLGLYKTELCRSWEEKGSCRYGTKCQFAHGEDELRKVSRHPKYKTEICRTFWVSGSCPYGKRCCFIHTELPGSGPPPGADGAPPPSHPSGRERSHSTNSDPNEVSSSLLARISAKRTQDGIVGSNTGSASTTPPSTAYQNNSSGRPGSLRVDTSVLDPASLKQNKSAYPTFAHGILMPANDEMPARSPGPVTAGPDFGRHAASRVEIVGSQHQRLSKNNSTNSNARHSFNGSEAQLDFSNVTPTATSNQQQAQQYTLSPEVSTAPPSRIHGHVRSGSAGTWGTATRTTHPLTSYPLSSIPGGEVKTGSPWADYSVGNSRLTEKTWV